MALDTRYIPLYNVQQAIINKDNGALLAAGKVYFYEDNARTTLKTIYRISGSPPNYTYTALPNPITLSSTGTFVDESGNDVVVYLFPYDGSGQIDLYYMVVEDSAGGAQFTREGVPNVGVTEEETSDTKNFIGNGQFLLHNNIPATDTTIEGQITSTQTNIAPGFWYFIRSVNTATDNVTFERFTSGVQTPTGNPRYAARIKCSSPSTDTEKRVVKRIPDVNKFSSEGQFTYSFTAKSNAGSGVQVVAKLRKFYGTGGTPAATEETTLQTFTLSTSYNPYAVSFSFGENIGKTLGTNDNDHVDLVLEFPTQSVFDISVTDFSLANGAIAIGRYPISTNQEMIYDSILGSLTVPDYDGNNLYLNPILGTNGWEFDGSNIGKFWEGFSKESPGRPWINMNGQTVIREDKVYSNAPLTYDRLYQVWNNSTVVNNGNAFGYGEDGFYPASYTNNVTFTQQKNGTITDWADNDTGFTFTKIRENSNYDIIPVTYFNSIRIINTLYGAVTASNVGTTKFVVYREITGVTVSPPTSGTIWEKETTRVLPTKASSITGGEYFTFNSTAAGYYVWYKVNGVGTDPAVGGRTGILVDLLTDDSQDSVILKTCRAINFIGAAAEAYPSYEKDNEQAHITFGNEAVGVVTAASAGTTTFSVSILQTGSATLQEITKIIFSVASSITGGQYWEFNSTTGAYYVWYKKDGVGADPAVGGRTGILVEILSSDSNRLVRLRTEKALKGLKETKITVPSVGLAGKYFFAYNTTEEFYVWFTEDGNGTDPKVSGKTGIKVEILSSDSTTTVALKISKAISSYYYVIPDMRGYFRRVFSNGSGRDNAINRKDRGDGTTGDDVGTTQYYNIEAHYHAGGFGTITEPLSIDDRWGPNGPSDKTEQTGSYETVPINISTNVFIHV